VTPDDDIKALDRDNFEGPFEEDESEVKSSIEPTKLPPSQDLPAR